ncbi:MAG: glycoside hydrolase [Bacteroidetes bacterium]|nr:MAG: glycoside hydrolase [Bacteroidota bacterium]
MRKLLLLFVILVFTSQLFSQSFNANYFNEMKWRCIGPHRGGRTVGAVGVPQQPNVFYIGVNNGGVWKTTDYGRTWFPIFDDQPTGSVGDVVVSPSNPNVIYVGCGEGLQRPDLSVGDGIYKSTDAGKTWTFLGLKDAQQIGGLAIDPTNENRLFVAALGHPYGPNEERGIYRTTDGGKTWEKVLYKDENTGAVQVTIDPNNPNIVFADLWAGRQGPWENGAWNGKESGLFKSIDGGTTWKKMTMGLPTTDQGLGRIGFCIAPTDSKRMYATVDAGRDGGIYRSDDAGESWKRMSSDNRYWGRASDFAEVKVDPKNADIVYSANVVTWKSIDGGKSWDAFRGAPGGDDYHRIWINPNNTNIILIASDQGAIITVNGGETFSSWYNQPTAQFYHVNTDNAFPYNVYSGQQESGSAMVASRSSDGQITYRDWRPVGAEEYGYVAPDPLNPNIIYGGKITRYDKRTGQTQDISPEAVRSGKYRFLRTAPVLFNPIDKKTLYYGGNVLFKTMNGGNSWQIISPDLTRETYDIPASVGIYTSSDMKTMPRRGVIYTVAPSYKDINTIWCGTDDGLIHVTRDGGKTWKNVTPPGITSWSKISLMDASHSNANTVYAAVNRIRCDDMRPHIYKTNDGGKTWKEIVNGLPNDPINVVREDPLRKGLLFAGSERAVYVSFDDGENWQSLRLNMPATSIRDLVIKDDDVVVGTHGRSFWILDNITSLRQLTEKLSASPTILYKPQPAYRIRWSMYTDTPVPQEEPAGLNPPDGAMIDYYLNEEANDVTLEIISKDAAGRTIKLRTYSNKDTLYKIGNVNIPQYWIRPQQILSTKEGHNRFMWNMKLDPLNIPPSYPISAIYKNTEPNQTAPWVMPGNYIVRLTVDGKVHEQSITIKMDPRVKTFAKDIQLQYDLSYQCYAARKECMKILDEIRIYRAKLSGDQNTPAIKEVALIENSPQGSTEPSFSRLNNSFASLFNVLQDSDMPPTTQMIANVKEAMKAFNELKIKWEKLKK